MRYPKPIQCLIIVLTVFSSCNYSQKIQITLETNQVGWCILYIVDSVSQHRVINLDSNNRGYVSMQLIHKHKFFEVTDSSGKKINDQIDYISVTEFSEVDKVLMFYRFSKEELKLLANRDESKSIDYQNIAFAQDSIIRVIEEER